MRCSAVRVSRLLLLPQRYKGRGAAEAGQGRRRVDARASPRLDSTKASVSGYSANRARDELRVLVSVAVPSVPIRTSLALNNPARMSLAFSLFGAVISSLRLEPLV